MHSYSYTSIVDPDICIYKTTQAHEESLLVRRRNLIFACSSYLSHSHPHMKLALLTLVPWPIQAISSIDLYPINKFM